MKRPLHARLRVPPAIAIALAFALSVSAQDPVKPLRALLILGGCCHDYAKQKDLLKAGLEQRANVKVDIEFSPDTSTKAVFPIYDKAGWATGYDVVIHDECSADISDAAVVRRILDAHRGGVPAVNLHCAMHSYRTGTDAWFEFTGIKSTGHGPQVPIAIRFAAGAGPITRGLTDWKTIPEELYNNVKLFGSARPLAHGAQEIKRSDGSTRTEAAVVVWVNDFHGTRVFNTTLGHNNETVSDPRYLDLVARGLLWACGKLGEDGASAAGFGPASKP